MARLRVLAFLGSLAAALPSFSAHAANFRDVLPGAKPTGMGGAYTAVADDPYAMFYNPAGIAGTDLTQLGSSFGRFMSPIGPLQTFTLAYTRPFPLRPIANVGAAFFNERQESGGDKDEFLMHYSEAFNLPDLYLSRPLKTGANFKILSVGPPEKGSKLGLGFDFGALMESNMGLKFGMSVTDFTTEAGVQNPSLNLGASYLLNHWLNLASDLKVRAGLTQFTPGLEASFYEGLLKVRMGKGLGLDGVGTVAFGIGVDYSPITIDYAMTVPLYGMTRPGGGSEITLNYKFGSPSFYGRFIGMAARQATDLRSDIAELEERKKNLTAQASSAQSNEESAEGQLRATEGRLRVLQDQLRAIEKKVAEKSYEINPPKPRAPRAAPAPPKPEPFPHRYKVQSGDTLRGIASEEYGDPNLWEIIYNANPEKVDRGLPQEGAVLIIPAPPPSAHRE